DVAALQCHHPLGAATVLPFALSSASLARSSPSGQSEGFVVRLPLAQSAHSQLARQVMRPNVQLLKRTSLPRDTADHAVESLGAPCAGAGVVSKSSWMRTRLRNRPAASMGR